MPTLWEKQAPSRVQKPTVAAPVAKTPTKTKPANKAAKKA
jgi:hypothetical protein